MNKKFNINTFNEILMKCIPAKKRKELLENELQTAYALKIEAMEKLVECLNHGNTYEEILQKINNIDSNCNEVAKMLEACVDYEERGDNNDTE